MANNPFAGFNVSYPAIERLIDSEDFSCVNKNFGQLYVDLEKLSKEKGGLGKVKQIRKGMKSIEKVMDILAELLKLKYRLMQTTESPSKLQGTGEHVKGAPPKGASPKGASPEGGTKK